jgi:hypothetical protein
MNIELEILQGSYWEHFKKGKNFALIYPVGHPKRDEIDKTLNEILIKIKNYENSRQ